MGKKKLDIVPQVNASKGVPKSGKFWKSEKARTTSMIKSRKKVGLNRLKEIQQEKQRVRELSQSIRDARKAELEEKRRREEENKKRKEENQRKSEIVQVIKNTAKIKRMKKKQLRKIVKRDTTVIEKDPPSQKMDTT